MGFTPVACTGEGGASEETLEGGGMLRRREHADEEGTGDAEQCPGRPNILGRREALLLAFPWEEKGKIY